MKKYLWYLGILIISMGSCQNDGSLESEESNNDVLEKVAEEVAQEQQLWSPIQSVAVDSSVHQRGRAAVAQATKVLGERLKYQMKIGGPLVAVEYCNARALYISDSLSQYAQGVVRRTSLKYRNGQNKPGPVERQFLVKYEQELSQGLELKPKAIQAHDGSIRYFSPIIIKPLCLNCHGKYGAEINDDLKTHLSVLYPTDMATGYELGDFRGMWDIVFNN